MSLSTNIHLRPPKLKDGVAVFRLIRNCPPLDPNSSYCNFLQCEHFSNTSVSAELHGELVAFISGYLIPERPDTLFIWQVAVDSRARKQGLAMKMLRHLCSRSDCGKVRYLETTITENNRPSWSLFESFAKKMSADIQSSEWLNRELHFSGQHDSEFLVRIGPFNSNKTRE